MKQTVKILMFISIMITTMMGCKKVVTHEQHGWIITADPKTSTISIEKDGLNKIANQIHLNINKDNIVNPLSGWTINKKNGELIINTEKPVKTKWEFKITDLAIDVVCSDESCIITGIAPAGEKRIPARIESQNNGIMYTQMGFVSATNIYNLFDMQTDIMIRFTENSKLKRNKKDNSLMDIQIPITAGNEFSIVKEYYTDVVGLSNEQKTDFKPVYKPISERFKTAPTGWSSWYCYYMSPVQEDLVAETDALADKLKPYGLSYVQLDAAYTRGKDANWLEWNKDMYPKGGKWWFNYVIEKGLKPGLWMNAYGANYAKPSMADKYPENYFLRDSLGHLSGACCSADTTVVRLDFTNPEVIEKHIKPLFKTLVNDWGFAYIKAGGWGTWMDYYEKNRKNAYNPDMDSRAAYISVIAAIREELGEDKYLLGCAMHEIGLGFDYFDGSRTGGDDYASWKGEGHWSDGMNTCFNSLFGENWLNGICWWSDPDDIMIRDPLNMEEAKTIVSTISLSGQAYIISDFIAKFSNKRLQNFLHSDYNIGWAKQYPDKVKALPDEKIELYRKTMPSMPIKAMDLYPFMSDAAFRPKPTEYPRALDLKVNAESGMYDVVALYNWDDEKAKKVLDVNKDLGLENETDYLVYDFWNHDLLKISDNIISEEVPAHGTKSLIIRKVTDNPQLLATSRHLTGAYSIQKMSWNGENKSLTGTSKTVPGDQYTLFIYVPDNYEFDKTEINAENINIKINSNNILEVSFTGAEEPIEWTVAFKD